MGALLSLAATNATGQTGSHDKRAQSLATVSCTDLDGRPEACPEQKETPDNYRRVVPPVTQDARNLLRGVVTDQKYLWTRPLHLHLRDAEWLVPVAGIATGLIVTDRTASHEISRGSHRGLSNEFSNAGLGALGLAAGSMYFFGRRSGDGQKRETGLLAVEAGIDSLAVDEALKYAFRRERPYQDSGRGLFSQPGGSSFPSAHAATAFTVATVIAHEYPEPFKQALAYGAATAISLARVKGQQHFPSDVFIGGAMGYLIGRSLYRKHHDSPVENYGVFLREPSALAASSMSSTYIELDSWIYPAVERLAALGVVKLEFLGLRPWTRMAVYQMLGQASESKLEPTAAFVSALQGELQREADVDSGGLNRAISIDQIYTRTQYISGQPLNDSYHFGQTIVDDFGRPFGHGLQQIIGFESRAERGRFSFFARGEYQHSPSIPGYSLDVEQIISRQDSNPVQTFNGLPSANVFRLQDTYVSMNLLGNEISVGKQSYWWGPGEGSAMMLGDNAEPFYSLRINRTVPWHIPLLSKLLGPARYDNFFGRLSGHHFPPGPFIYGQKISFRPSENLEFGFARDAVFAGQGISPLTISSFWHSFTSFSSGTESPGFQLRTNPGARHTSFDVTYRVPGLRNWLTFYTDSVIHDGISPIESPRRSAVTPGIYLARFPGIPKLDLHIEGGTTDTTPARAKGGQFYYWEAIYRDAYTNKGSLLGSWLGREGTGGQAWATYWFNPKSTLRIGYRTVKVSHFFIPHGETQQDGYAELNCQWRNGLGVQIFVQGERWVAPALASGPQTDVTTRIQLLFSPKNWSVTKR